MGPSDCMSPCMAPVISAARGDRKPVRLRAPRRYGRCGDPGGAAADAGVGALHAVGDFLVEEIRPDPAGEAAEVAELHAVAVYWHACGMTLSLLASGKTIDRRQHDVGEAQSLRLAE